MGIQGVYHTIIINIDIVDEKTAVMLNIKYMNKDYVPNVLALEYPSERESGVLMGDVFLCDSIITKEANVQKKPLKSHYTHLIIHGILHIQGYDHKLDTDADIMESLEISLLAKLNIANPYLQSYQHN